MGARKPGHLYCSCQEDPGDSTDKPESENTMSTAVVVALLVVGFGFAILCIRTVVVIFILVQDKVGIHRIQLLSSDWWPEPKVPPFLRITPFL